MSLLMLLLAAAAPPAPAPAGQTVAAPAPGTPPQRIYLTNCPQPVGDEIVVCGALDSQRLPLPWERGSIGRPLPSNPDLSAATALAESRSPCATLQGGCQTGIDLFGAGTALVRLVGKAIDPDSCCDQPGEATNVGALIGDIGKAFRKKPDKSQRVAIALDAPPPSIKGRLSP